MAQPRVLSELQERQIAKRYASGALTSELADEYGVHKDTVRAIVQRQGGQLRARGGREGVPRARVTSS